MCRISFWDNQALQDYDMFQAFCHSRADTLFPDQTLVENTGKVTLRSFYEVSSRLASARSSLSFYGLELNLTEKHVRLHKGSTGNSIGYDYEQG